MAGRLALFVCALAVAAFMGWSQFAALFDSDDPAYAARMAPWRAGATLNAAAAAIEADPQAARARLLASMWREPGDARFYSLLGSVAHALKDEALARRLFEATLSLSKAEGNALQHLASYAAQKGDTAQAVDYLDTLMRRRQDLWEPLAPAFAALAQTQQGYAALLKRMTNTATAWRAAYVRYLISRPDLLDLLYNTASDIDASDRPLTKTEKHDIQWALFSAKDYERSYRLFVSTLDDAGRRAIAPGGFNQTFALPPTSLPFDWRIQDTDGVEIRRDEDGKGGVTVSFADRPVTKVEFSQMILLRPGEQAIEVAFSGQRYVAPQPLAWVVRCWPSYTEIGRLRLSVSGTGSWRLKRAFDVPETGCNAQRLSLESELLSNSWTQRFSGALTFTSVAINRPVDDTDRPAP